MARSALVANFDVVTGKAIVPTIGSTRTEEDFAKPIARTIDTDLDATRVFELDQLNTHKSGALVRLIAGRCSIDDDLSMKGKRGVRKTMASRKRFLADLRHRLRVVYTPRHASWLNQVEIWFSILARRARKRASFISLDDLCQRLLNFIDSFHAGKPLLP